MDNIIDLNFINKFLYCNYETYYTNPNYKEDLVSEAVLEVCEHVTQYDSNIASFKAWATPHINRGALKFLMGLYNLPEYYVKLRKKANAIIERASENGKEITYDDLARENKISKKAASIIGRKYVALTSIFENTNYVSKGNSVENDIMKGETLKEIESVLNSLTEEEREVIEARADAICHSDFLVRMRNLGYKKGTESRALKRVEAKACKYIYENKLFA